MPQQRSIANIVNRLSHQMRETLVAHVPGPQVITRTDSRINATRHALVARHLLTYDREMRPRTTHLTHDGRETAAFILGAYHDALAAVERAKNEQGAPLAPVAMPQKARTP